MPLGRILAAPAANLQVQVNLAVANVETRVVAAVASAVQSDIDATVAERVVVLDAGRQAYVHSQPEPSLAWYVRHGLPFDPAALDVVTADGARWWPDVDRSQPGVVVLLFPEPVAGTVRLS